MFLSVVNGSSALTTLADNSPLIAVMILVISALVYTIKYIYNVVEKKDKQILNITENNMKLTALYEARLSNSAELQRNSSKEHQQLMEISNASFVILNDLKSKLL